MKKIFFSIFLMLCMATFANAMFIKSTDDANEKLYLIDSQKNVSLFDGSIGVNSSDAVIDISTSGSVNTGNGWANFKPIKDGNLTMALFTPVDGAKFSEFSFHAQLIEAGYIYVKVMSYTGAVYDFEFGEFKANTNIGPIGVSSEDGDWFTSLAIFTSDTDSFKEIKQISLTPVPEPGTMVLLGAGMLGLAIFGKRRMNRE